MRARSYKKSGHKLSGKKNLLGRWTSCHHGDWIWDGERCPCATLSIESFIVKLVIACILMGQKEKTSFQTYMHSRTWLMYLFWGHTRLQRLVTSSFRHEYEVRKKKCVHFSFLKSFKTFSKQLLQLECSLQQRASNYNVKMMMMMALWVPSSCFESCVLTSCIDFWLKFLPGQGFSIWHHCQSNEF